jgi:hypothetical protein
MKKMIIRKISRILSTLYGLSPYIERQVSLKLVKANASRNSIIDSVNPYSWEFSGFSQNGEDGIIDFLSSKIQNPNKYFVEIGASNGLENNTSYLAIAKHYSGVMIDGSVKEHKICKEVINRFCMGVDCLNMFVDTDSVEKLKDYMLYLNPDIFSLDIDGNDYYLAETIINAGIRPKIFVVEYNSAFGPEKSITIKYDKDFVLTESHSSFLYYGVSIAGWKRFFVDNDYQFICVDSNGINGFFIDKREFDENFYQNINGFQFRENFWQKKKFKKDWERQFELIKDLPFKTI